MAPSRPSSKDVVVSEELRAPVATGIELCYQTYGVPTDDPLLLVMGLSAPMTWWDDRLCRLLAGSGFYVVRFDNRDTGRSGRGEGRVTRADLVKAFLGLPGRPPYPLSAMADDAVGLLDHLGIDRAHVVGASMGGMIVQTMAIEHPDRVASMVSIMSTTGRRTVGWQHPALLPRMIAPRARSREAYIENALAMGTLIGSPGYPEDPEEASARAGETFDRGVSASGVLRQMVAILRQPNRSRALRSVRVPAAVIHGSADRMVHVSGGRATAAAIPEAELVVLDGMGHDLPPALYDTYVEVIRRTADRARA
ncbi:alpha/beta fold hydrolase [Nocardioides terrisoli]|uniref:alpha/beta fold hydrolase n=1 Tax=Nocardioides terrisoli TaxID=3388267 RepID=UPI00287B8E05|nr:alpha/beta hydrolase [Nocardioides marmorisolisilvae]